MGLTNFYIVQGDIKVAREYLENLGFTECIETKDNNYGYIIIATAKKLFWKVKIFDIRTVKNIIVSKCREAYTELSFEEFQKEYEANIEVNQPVIY